mgnify:CR=1 FL=1
MAKTLRTSGDYTIKAGDGYNSGSGTNSITLDSLNVTVNGNLTVGGSGKTPLTIWLYNYFSEKKLKFAKFPNPDCKNYTIGCKKNTLLEGLGEGA